MLYKADVRLYGAIEFSVGVADTKRGAVCSALKSEMSRPGRRSFNLEDVRLVDTGGFLQWAHGGDTIARAFRVLTVPDSGQVWNVPDEISQERLYQAFIEPVVET